MMPSSTVNSFSETIGGGGLFYFSSFQAQAMLPSHRGFPHRFLQRTNMMLKKKEEEKRDVKEEGKHKQKIIIST